MSENKEGGFGKIDMKDKVTIDLDTTLDDVLALHGKLVEEAGHDLDISIFNLSDGEDSFGAIILVKESAKETMLDAIKILCEHDGVVGMDAFISIVKKADALCEAFDFEKGAMKKGFVPRIEGLRAELKNIFDNMTFPDYDGIIDTETDLTSIH